MNFSDALMDNNCMYKPIDLYIRTFSPNYKMERHKHDQVEIMYVKTGSFNVHIYDNKENETILHIYESQFLVIDINIEHYIEITTNVKILNLELLIKSNPYQPDVFKLSPILRRNENYTNFCKEMVGYGIFNADETFPDLLSLFIKAIQNGYNDNYDYTQSLLLALLLNIGNCYKNVKRNTYSYYTSMIINHINADLSNDLSISKLEKKLNVSKSYIHRCFKKDTGVSITE